jgi:hypothetical protein
MSNFSAIIPVAEMGQANASLEAQGYGPNNFSIPAFDSARPGFALFHAWSDPAFRTAVELLPNVIITSGEETPAGNVTAACNEVGATWAQDALPLTGVVTPGLYYYTDDSMWWVIQQYDTAIWPDPYAPGLQALVVPARMPGVITVWVQPINQFTAYYLVNPFTGLPDEVTHNVQTWVVDQADGAGFNIWEPGVFGWVVKS